MGKVWEKSIAKITESTDFKSHQFSSPLGTTSSRGTGSQDGEIFCWHPCYGLLWHIRDGFKSLVLAIVEQSYQSLLWHGVHS